MLPILQTTHDDMLRYFRRGELQWARHLGQETQLDFGVAICNPDLDMHDANRILDAVLPVDANPSEIIAQADALFAAAGSRCHQWTLNDAEDISRQRALIDSLSARNFHRCDCDVMRLVSPPDLARYQRDDLQIIPARASFRHARQIAEESARFRGCPHLADAAMLHLDDPQWDALLALKNGTVVGRLGVLSGGDVGRIENVFVSERFRRQGIAGALLARGIEICQRSQFRHVLLGVSTDNAPAISLYQKFGFTKVAEAPSFISS